MWTILSETSKEGRATTSHYDVGTSVPKRVDSLGYKIWSHLYGNI